MKIQMKQLFFFSSVKTLFEWQTYYASALLLMVPDPRSQIKLPYSQQI